jgi:hypothetical protein
MNVFVRSLEKSSPSAASKYLKSGFKSWPVLQLLHM